MHNKDANRDPCKIHAMLMLPIHSVFWWSVGLFNSTCRDLHRYVHLLVVILICECLHNPPRKPTTKPCDGRHGATHIMVIVRSMDSCRYHPLSNLFANDNCRHVLGDVLGFV